MNKIVYVKQNNYRRDEYNIVSTIEIDANGKKYVYKTAKNNEGAKFLNSFFDKYEYLSRIYKNTNLIILKPNKISSSQLYFEYFEFENFENILLKAIGEKNINELKAKINDFFKLVFTTKKTEPNFKNLESVKNFFDSSKNYVNGTPLIDINFDNFLYKDGKFYLVDFEWTFDLNFDPEFLKNRTFFYFLKRNMDFLVPNRLVEELNINKDSLKAILAFESKFIEKLSNQTSNQYDRLYREFDDLFHIHNADLLPKFQIDEALNKKIIVYEQQVKEINLLRIKADKLDLIENSLLWKLTKPLRTIPSKRS